MGTLTTKQLKHLTALMDERFSREIEEIGAVSTRTRTVRGLDRWSADTGGSLERTLTDVALKADAAVVGQDARDVRDIAAARRRIAAGTCGICIECGGAIGYQRLLAYPTAKRCIGSSASTNASGRFARAEVRRDNAGFAGDARRG